MTAPMLDATFYVQLIQRGRKAKATAITQGLPYDLSVGTVLVKLTIRVPESAFKVIAPEAVITVPEDMIRLPHIEVEAADANGGGE